MEIKHYISFNRGGIAAFLQALVRAQSELYDPSLTNIAVFGPAELQFPSLVKKLEYLPFGDSTWGLNQWKFTLQSTREIRRSRHPGTLNHTHHFTIDKQDIHTVHGLYCRDWEAMFRGPWGKTPTLFHRLQYFLLRSLERRTFKSARWVVFASDENRRFVENELGISRPGRFRVIHHGVDTHRYQPGLRANLHKARQQYFPDVNPQTRWLLFVGNNYLLKGLLRILNSLSEMNSEVDMVEFDFLVVGNDPMYIEMAKELSRRISLSKIHFFDDSQIPEAFALSDLFLMDSESEAGPLVLLEAMASGCVPVVTSFGYAEEFIQSGKNGWVVENCTAIVKAALQLSASKIGAMSECAVETVSRQTWGSVAEEYLDLYCEIESERINIREP
jgi:glycosyltransferase involved in cell wall biosynthesis